MTVWALLAGAQDKGSLRAVQTTVTTVARRVWRTFPDQRPLPPIVVVSRGEQPGLARFRPKPAPVLFINERLYELCRTFGNDSLTALALIIGHELAHYHAHHKEWLEIAQYRRGGTAVSPVEAKTLVPLESFADREGALHAYLAGYDAFRLLKPLYRRIYQTYGLPDQMPGYPSRETRIDLSLAQLASVRPTILLIDAATFLFALGEYDLAESCLTTVVQQWPAVEIQNNLASLYVKKALGLTTCLEMPFRLPVEWDAYNRLLTLRQHTEENEKKYYLEEARTYAQQANRGDPDYEPAALNLAIVNVLDGRFGTAADLLAPLTHRPVPDPDAMAVTVIAQLLQTRDLAKARADFGRISGSANEAHNRSALASWPGCPPATKAGPTPVVDAPEKGVAGYRFPLSGGMPAVLEINGSHYLNVTGRHDDRTDTDLLRITHGSDHFYDVLRTSSPDWPTLRGLRVGQPEQDILARYGSPDSLPVDDGHNRLYVYRGAGLLVLVRSGFVCQLVVFHHTS